MNTMTIAPEIEGLEVRMKQTGITFYEQLDIPARSQMLNAACGWGQLALWAGREEVPRQIEWDSANSIGDSCES